MWLLLSCHPLHCLNLMLHKNWYKWLHLNKKYYFLMSLVSVHIQDCFPSVTVVSTGSPSVLQPSLPRTRITLNGDAPLTSTPSTLGFLSPIFRPSLLNCPISSGVSPKIVEVGITYSPSPEILTMLMSFYSLNSSMCFPPSLVSSLITPTASTPLFSSVEDDNVHIKHFLSPSISWSILSQDMMMMSKTNLEHLKQLISGEKMKTLEQEL